MLLPNGDKRDIHRGEISSRPRREAPEGPETMLEIFGFLFKSCPCAMINRRSALSTHSNTDPVKVTRNPGFCFREIYMSNTVVSMAFNDIRKSYREYLCITLCNRWSNGHCHIRS